MEKNRPGKDWGIKEHWNIPYELLDVMASDELFNIDYVRKAAAQHARRYIEPMQDDHCSPFESRDDVEALAATLRGESVPRMIKEAMGQAGGPEFLQLGQILEYRMVADVLEEFMKKQTEVNPDRTRA